MALTVYYAQKGNRNMQVILILLTMFFGLVFLGVKTVEYGDKYRDGLVPVTGWNRKVKEDTAHAAAAGEHAKPCWEMGHGAEHTYVNPRGEFQFPDCSMAKQAFDQQQKDPGGNHMTAAEQIGYFSNGQIDADKFRDKVRLFYWIYFVMTGLHALHMIVGIGLMLWLLWKAWLNTFSHDYFAPVEMGGLYWHFVDIVWIFLFPLLYLLGRHFMH